MSINQVSPDPAFYQALQTNVRSSEAPLARGAANPVAETRDARAVQAPEPRRETETNTRREPPEADSGRDLPRGSVVDLRA